MGKTPLENAGEDAIGRTTPSALERVTFAGSSGHNVVPPHHWATTKQRLAYIERSAMPRRCHA